MPNLVLSVGGEVAGLERAMGTALALASTKSRSIEQVFAASGERINAGFVKSIASASVLGTVVRGIALAGGIFLAFEALEYVIDAVRDAASEAVKEMASLVKIGTQARDLGVGTTFLQSFLGQFERLGLERQQLEAMLATAREASTLRIGEGETASTSKMDDRIEQNERAGNLGKGSRAAFDGADTQEQRIRVVLGLMDQLQAKGAVLAELDLGKTMFGEDFERSLRAGVDVIGAMKQGLDGVAATADGRVKSEQEIADAQRISAEYQSQNVRLAAAWSGYNKYIAEYEASEADTMVWLRGLFVDVVEAAEGLVGWLVKGLEYLESMGAAAIRLASSISRAVMSIPRLGGLSDFLPAQDGAPAEAPRPLTIHPRHDTSHTLPSLAPVHTHPKHAREAADKKDEVDNLITSLAKSAAAEEGDAAAVGKSNAEKQRSIDLAKAEEAAKERGSALTEEERKKIVALADAYSTAEKKIDDYKKAKEKLTSDLDDIRSGAKDVLHGFVQDLQAAKSGVEILSDALHTLANKIESRLEDNLIDSLFGKSGTTNGGLLNIGALFTSLGSIAHADGGIITGPGGGRADKIPALLSAGEGVIPADVVRNNGPLVRALIARRYADGGIVDGPSVPAAVRSAAAGGGSYTHAPTYVLPSSPAGTSPEDVVRMIAAYDRQARRTVLPTLARARQRAG